MRSKYICFILFCLLVFSATAQKRKIEITQCDIMTGDRSVRKLFGNVGFSHQNARMYCDSAHFFVSDNRFEAFGEVRIYNEGVTIHADTLFYSSQTSLAQLRGAITMTNQDMTLTTHKLDYNVKENVGYYFDNGKITDRENVLTSKVGTFYVNDDRIQFTENVVLQNKDYTIRTNNLSYHTVTKIASFTGPTRVESEQNLLYTENGWYNTQTNIAQGVKNSYLNSKSHFIYGDTLHYNRNTDIGTAHQNVHILDTIEKISLFGSEGFLDGIQKLAFATGKLLVVKDFETDSLYLHADSVFVQRFVIGRPQTVLDSVTQSQNQTDTVAKPLVATDSIAPLSDSVEYSVIKIYHRVRFFKSDIQGVCDSLHYNSLDSVIWLHTRPIIWHGANQLTGRSIQLRLINDQIEEIFVDADAFVVEQDLDSTQFNQIKGTALKGYIKDNKLYQVDIHKNSEFIYFMRDKGDLIGINKLLCADITAYLVDGKLSSFTFRQKPDGFIDPPNAVSKEEQKLDKFEWHSTVRPLNKDDIFNWR
ncbi:MAG: hypothetical protein LBM68_04340 [Bacteroidales bacterium]|jgi:lipopolysaccharide export system protein LptA|nr:hypothetical protein [Bacteroidales bacterium]